MKWSITCFSNIRYMNKHILPISTITKPPSFFRSHPTDNLFHFDKNGVLLGIICNELSSHHAKSSFTFSLCPCKEKDYENCEFLKKYYNYLKTIDFRSFIDKYEKLARAASNELEYEIKEVVIIVYEKELNKCSERTVIKKWFKDNRYELEEFKYE